MSLVSRLPVRGRKWKRTAPPAERVEFSDDVWLPLIQPDFDRGKGGGLMSNAERCNLQQTFVQLCDSHWERSSVRPLRFVHYSSHLTGLLWRFSSSSEAGLCLYFTRVTHSAAMVSGLFYFRHFSPYSYFIYILSFLASHNYQACS